MITFLLGFALGVIVGVVGLVYVANACVANMSDKYHSGKIERRTVC